jgi:hypothetical protein
VPQGKPAPGKWVSGLWLILTQQKAEWGSD